MKKLDLTKAYRAYYSARTTPELLVFPQATYLSITGQGDPSASLYAEKVQTLYAVAYGVKFGYKAAGKDYGVAKLEGLWWYDTRHFENVTMHEAPQKIPRSEWCWRLLIRVPDYVEDTALPQAVEVVARKKLLAMAHTVERYTLPEGRVVQMLHVGPFDKEPETLAQMASFMRTNHLQKAGCHHEIYLSDFNRTPPEKLRTILREPVQ